MFRIGSVTSKIEQFYDKEPFVYLSIDDASDNSASRNTCSNTPHTFRNSKLLFALDKKLCDSVVEAL